MARDKLVVELMGHWGVGYRVALTRVRTESEAHPEETFAATAKRLIAQAERPDGSATD